MRWAIVDIDGTISDCSARVGLANAAKQEKDPTRRSALWDEFHSLCHTDPPHLAEVEICRAWLLYGKIAFLTGRTERWRSETQAWLLRFWLPSTPLFMRDSDNYSGSLEYKRSRIPMIQALMTSRDSIAWVMEDQDRLVEQWRMLGYTCLQPRRSAFGEKR